ERLAHHALAAERWPQALAYCRQAGARAAWRSAHREAVQYFEGALEAIRRLPETHAIQEETLDLYTQLRWSLVPLGEYPKVARRQPAPRGGARGGAGRFPPARGDLAVDDELPAAGRGLRGRPRRRPPGARHRRRPREPQPGDPGRLPAGARLPAARGLRRRDRRAPGGGGGPRRRPPVRAVWRALGPFGP